ncbi:MAG: hypothetical protein ABIO45_06005 [Burkholderiaceae bacterium]
MNRRLDFQRAIQDPARVRQKCRAAVVLFGRLARGLGGDEGGVRIGLAADRTMIAKSWANTWMLLERSPCATAPIDTCDFAGRAPDRRSAR